MLDAVKWKSLNKYLWILVVPLVFMYWLNSGGWITPDLFFIGAVILVASTGKLGRFVKDWAPLLLILFFYEYVRAFVPNMLERTHTTEFIVADTWLFGFIPTMRLQEALWFGKVRIFDIFLVFSYTLHFVMPQIFAFSLWIKSRMMFRLFAVSLVALSIAGVITYYIYPATPPWLASAWGYVKEVEFIANHVYRSMNFHHLFSIPKELSLYAAAGANPVAAFPSLHVAYPFLIALFATYFYKIKGLFVLIYPYIIMFTVIYTGDHWYVDVIAGVIYASVTFLTVVGIYRLWLNLKSKRAANLVAG